MLLAAALVFSSAVLAAPEDRVRPAWEELSLLDPNAAQELFHAAATHDPASREARFGEALAQLNAQPRSETRLADARRLFEALRSENSDDDTGIAATYYLARLRQIHDYATDRTPAILAYRTLLAAHPGHPVAELAAPKLALLLLYDDVAPAVWEQRVQEILALLPQLRSPEGRRDTRLILADALIKLRRDHARAYPLLTDCLAAGLIVRVPRLNSTLLQAAESARLLGRDSEAAAHYARYLELFPRDIKSSEVRARLAALSGKAAP
jgi:hypothetical protein